MINKTDITDAIRRLNLQNSCVCIHSSMKSFGCRIGGGAQAVIDAFLSENCTVMVPAFDDDCAVYPPKHLRPKRNGTGENYTRFENRRYKTPKIFTPERNDITRQDMGLLPYTLLQMSTRKRGGNPLASMAAAGPCAGELVSGQSALDVWAPFQKLVEKNGMVLLIGVDLSCATIIHFAEQLAGRAPFVRWASDSGGTPAVCHTGGCSGGFENFSGVLKSIEKSVTVGQSLWRCFPARQMADICVNTLKENPHISHCGDPNCARCRDAILGGPIWADND